MEGRTYYQKTLHHRIFKHSRDLEKWANENIEVTQIVNISASESVPHYTWTLWYWEMENKPIKNPNIKIE